MLVVQLENKKLDVQIVYDRVLVQTEATQKLQIVSASKHSKIIGTLKTHRD